MALQSPVVAATEQDKLMGVDREVTLLQKLYQVDLAVAGAIFQAFEGNRIAFYVLEFVSLTGDGILWLLTVLPLLIVAWVFGFMKTITPGQGLFIVFFYLCQVDIVFIIIFKLMFRRARPPHHKTDARFAGPDQHSFPSGHSTRSFCLVGLIFYLAAYYPKALHDTLGAWAVKGMPVVVVVWATAICFCRLALGRHYPTDVLAGSVLGVLLEFPVAAVLIPYIAPTLLKGAASV
ncbi:hypothetical protein DYB36_008433 [Aphanomyces astaci]|uniref:Phosphatidic acid phosphatase type 2/haloperoxidase domain-containing protein n=1 Tax=Aphanomyces astaci TaxID=112090 RepID=A0A397BVM6_APHAT|nr:hypothetical protein DYB36_008433 [Aphanomyces astaci]